MSSAPAPPPRHRQPAQPLAIGILRRHGHRNLLGSAPEDVELAGRTLSQGLK